MPTCRRWRGQGNYLQRYKDGGLLDATTFTWKQGLKDENNREFPASELKEWRGQRAQAGRLVPRGWAKSKSKDSLKAQRFAALRARSASTPKMT